MPASLCSQVEVGRPWTMECGSSTNTFFDTPSSFNFRYISPRFKWSEQEVTEDEEKHPEKYRNCRLMLELIYTPPLQVLSSGFNVQYRLLRLKRLSLELYGGLKFFFVPGQDFVNIRALKSGREIWYINEGLILQFNLGLISPFVDVGGDGILTVGTEINIHAIYRKPKSRYKLKPR